MAAQRKTNNGSDQFAPHQYKHEKYGRCIRKFKVNAWDRNKIVKLQRVISFMQSDWL